MKTGKKYPFFVPASISVSLYGIHYPADLRSSSIIIYGL